MNQKDKLVKALEEIDRSPLCLLLDRYDPNYTTEKSIIEIAFIKRDRLFENHLLLTRDGIVTRVWYTAADDCDEYGRYEGEPKKIDVKDFSKIAKRFKLTAEGVSNSLQDFLVVVAEKKSKERTRLTNLATNLAKSSATK
mgnify:CR=1 FL=1